MESQGSTQAQAVPLPDKHAPAYTEAPVGTSTGPMPVAGQVYPPQGQPYPPQGQPHPGMFPPGQNPTAYTTVPQVQNITHQPLSNPPDDYFIHAILVTIFCFWPTGIIAIIKSLDSRRAAQMGDAQSAFLSAQAARKMSLISLFVGIAILVIIAIMIVIVVVVSLL